MGQDCGFEEDAPETHILILILQSDRQIIFAFKF